MMPGVGAFMAARPWVGRGSFLGPRATARVSSPHPPHSRPYNDYDGGATGLVVVRVDILRIGVHPCSMFVRNVANIPLRKPLNPLTSAPHRLRMRSAPCAVMPIHFSDNRFSLSQVQVGRVNRPSVSRLCRF